MDETMAACKLRLVFCHECGTSIQPGGLSMAMMDRSSWRIGMSVPSASSMQLGFGTGGTWCVVREKFGRHPASFVEAEEAAEHAPVFLRWTSGSLGPLTNGRE